MKECRKNVENGLAGSRSTVAKRKVDQKWRVETEVV